MINSGFTAINRDKTVTGPDAPQPSRTPPINKYRFEQVWPPEDYRNFDVKACPPEALRDVAYATSLSLHRLDIYEMLRARYADAFSFESFELQQRHLTSMTQHWLDTSRPGYQEGWDRGENLEKPWAKEIRELVIKSKNTAAGSSPRDTISLSERTVSASSKLMGHPTSTMGALNTKHTLVGSSRTLSASSITRSTSLNTNDSLDTVVRMTCEDNGTLSTVDKGLSGPAYERFSPSISPSPPVSRPKHRNFDVYACPREALGIAALARHRNQMTDKMIVKILKSEFTDDPEIQKIKEGHVALMCQYWKRNYSGRTERPKGRHAHRHSSARSSNSSRDLEGSITVPHLASPATSNGSSMFPAMRDSPWIVPGQRDELTAAAPDSQTRERILAFPRVTSNPREDSVITAIISKQRRATAPPDTVGIYFDPRESPWHSIRDVAFCMERMQDMRATERYISIKDLCAILRFRYGKSCPQLQDVEVEHLHGMYKLGRDIGSTLYEEGDAVAMDRIAESLRRDLRLAKGLAVGEERRFN
ncbi:hypothetical protein MMC28_006416 [Mycoblastus sanguinarius]|nr:hypothetical protein [Mycoblastus sanguinarius]